MIPTQTSPRRQRILDRVDAVAADLKRIALDIHARPELGFEEHHAASLWSEFLEQHRFAVDRGVADLETAFRATAGNGATGVAFMLEYDALPGLGHACGHHLNGAAACGAAIGLAEIADEVDGRVVAFGCPGEEGLGGKVRLVEAALLDGLTCAMMAHARDRHIGAMGHSAVAKFRVVFHGTSAHAAAAPAQAVNALDAVILLFNAVSAMRQHIRDGSRIHGVIVDGGHVPNIIPDRAEALFYIRDMDDAYLADLERRFMDIVAGAALQTGTRAEVQPYGLPYTSNIPNRALDQAYRKHAAELGMAIDPHENTISPASTDMGNVSHVVPSIHPAFKAAPEGTPIHSTAFAEASADADALASMVATAKALALTGWDVLTDTGLRRDMAAAFLTHF